MSKPQHPELEQLIGYIESPHGKSDRNIALHLASCNECRLHVSNLMRLQQKVKSMATVKTTSSEDVLRKVDEKAIVSNQLSGEQIHHLKSEKQRLKAALYLSSQASAINRMAEQKSAPLSQAKPPSLTSWWRKLGEFLPRWEYAALTASLTLAIILSVSLSQQRHGTHIVAYSDNPVLVFKKIKSDTPGIGFFSDAINSSRNYSGVVFKAQGNDNWSAEWPQIAGAESYLLQLYRVVNGRNELLFEERSRNTSVTIRDLTLAKHVRYEWKLSGDTTNQDRFSTNGGFVIQ